MSERKKSGELENQGPVSEALEGKGQENAGVDANQAAETGMEAEAAAPETEETAVDAADDKAAVADAGALPDDDEVYEEEPEAPVEAESETETPPTEEPPAEEPKPRRRRTTRNAEGDAAAEARPTRRRSAASAGEPTEAQKLERERREDNINRMLRSQQRAERNEKNQKFYAGISALQEAMRRKLILHGTVASVEQLSVANTGAAAQRVTTMLGVILDGRFKVLIPFAEFYRDNPIDMSKVDLKSGEGVENFNRRQRQLAERLYGCNIDFVVTHVEVTDPNDYRKSKRNALGSGLASIYPFVSYEMSDEDGILLGSQDNGSLVLLDNFDTKKYNNANICIMGSSGAGKTYLLQGMALRFREKQTQVFIIAPDKGHEFKRACEAIGGQFITIAPGSGQNINILVANSNHIFIEVQASPTEHKLITTDRGDLSALAAEHAAEEGIAL